MKRKTEENPYFEIMRGKGLFLVKSVPKLRL